MRKKTIRFFRTLKKRLCRKIKQKVYNFLNSYMTVDQIVNYFSDFFMDFRKELAYEMLAKLEDAKKEFNKFLEKRKGKLHRTAKAQHRGRGL